MVKYTVEMHHTEKSFEALAHMQYNLFCKGNKIGRSILSAAVILLGVSSASGVWGILLVAYGCYLITSTYSSANHTAHKLASQLNEAGLPFPKSRYIFSESRMDIVALPEETVQGKLEYSNVCKLGEDRQYFYIFKDRYGGYMVSKEDLGERIDEFREFMQQATKKIFYANTAPIIRLIRRVSWHRSMG